jgi:hypothetical protein
VLNNCEKYNDTRRWRCYEAALLLKKETEIRTDEEAPLTTPVDASVLRHYRFPVRDRLCFALQKNYLEIENPFLGKDKKQIIFFFCKKKSIPLLVSYLFFSSEDMTLIPGVYISTLNQ